MDLEAFHKLRNGVQGNKIPGSRKELAAVEEHLRETLLTSGIFEDVEVKHTVDPDRFVVALCRFASDYSEDEIAELMEWMWNDHVSYTYWQAHSLVVHHHHLGFEAATRDNCGGHYVTLHMVARELHLPAQRVSVD